MGSTMSARQRSAALERISRKAHGAESTPASQVSSSDLDAHSEVQNCLMEYMGALVGSAHLKLSARRRVTCSAEGESCPK
jgi:hypothetical protein